MDEGLTIIFELRYMAVNTGVYILRGADETKLRRLYRKHVSECEVQGIRSPGVTNKERNYTTKVVRIGVLCEVANGVGRDTSEVNDT